MSLKEGGKKSYTDEFKRDAVEQYFAPNAVRKDVLKKLGIHHSMVNRWRSLHKDVTARKYKSYTDEFRRDAVARANAGEPINKLCDDLKIHSAMLYKWRSKLAKQDAVKPGRGPQKSLKIGGGNSVQMEAIVYLRNAKKAMTKQIGAGKATLDDPVYSWCLLALNTLEGTM